MMAAWSNAVGGGAATGCQAVSSGTAGWASHGTSPRNAVATTRAPGTRSGRENTPICSTCATSRTSTFSASCRSTDASTSSSAPSLPPGNAHRPSSGGLARRHASTDSAPSRICSTAASTSCSVPTSAILGRDLRVRGRGLRARASRAPRCPARQMSSRSRGGCARGGVRVTIAPGLRLRGGNMAVATPTRTWAAEVRELARRRDAVLLAHNYQLPEIQDVADHTGDSLALSRIAARSSASTIVFCGVHFMAETAKILAPDKTVLIPDAAAGCSLADSITADELRAWKAEHPGAVVVSYVNTTAAVKAETDVCCTSSNAVEVVASIPADREVLFLPDQFLGAHVRRVTGRTNLHVWAGECHVHAGINGDELADKALAYPDAELFVHPECGCATSALYLAGAGAVPADRVKILSTGGMLDAARRSSAATVLVATEVGMLHQLRRAAPEVTFRAVNE